MGKRIALAILVLGVAVAGIAAWRAYAPGMVRGCTAEARICPDGTAVGRSGPNCEFAACPNGDAMFDKTGVITADNPGAPGLRFVYEAPGAPALTKIVVFDEQSVCSFPTGTTTCISMSAPPATTFGGKRVRLVGIDSGADLLVRTLELVSESLPSGEQTVTARIEQSAQALGITIIPRQVLEDSRCPADVQCVWAGTVKVKTSVTGSRGTATLTLELGKGISTESGTITLTAVSPEKQSQSEIASRDYVFTFSVVR